jgi:acyl-CoA synthetase (AMP-forming)/AMP-acid ligase II
VIGVTTLFHVFGLGPGILGSVLSGAALILQEEFDAEEALALVEKHRATVHYGVPTAFAAELQAQRENPRDLSSIRAGIVAGAPLREDLFREVEQELCPVLLNAYSMTEASSTLAHASFEDPPEKRRFTVGRPVPGTTIRILERDGSDLPPESVGELAVKGPGVMRGYYRQPRETAECFDAQHFFRTGDLAMLDEEGYLHLVGSLRDVIIRGGFNVFPREVEDRLHAHPAVDDAAVVGIPDAVLGEAVCAAVVLEEGAIVDGEEIREWCRGTLAGPKVPDMVRFFDALPMTGAGKVSRIDLVRLVAAEDSVSI